MSLKQSFILFFLLLASLSLKFFDRVESVELLPFNPVANSSAVVTSGNARFTVLTNNIIRMEYDSNKKFEDRATPAIINRNLPVPKFTSQSSGGTLTITTDSVKLTYKENSEFSGSTLSVESTSGSFKTWKFGAPNTGNLLGTIKSLDQLPATTLNCTQLAGKKVHDESLHCQWGLISRDGWSVIDDSKNWGLDDKNEWWDTMNVDQVDYYFLGFGNNYKQALSEYTLLGGKISMVPRSTVGVWWSVWYNLNNYDVKEIVHNYETHSIPLDVYILDMDWHSKQGWGGYSFDRRLFPHPENTLGWLHSKGLIIGANVHDDDGIRTSEDTYTDMAKCMSQSSGNIAFDVCGKNSQTYMDCLEDVALAYDEKLGMDFWWIDWQQGGTQGGCAGEKQNPTIWLNHCRSTDHVRRSEDKRGLVLARWGGLGSHRYQVGFSGDVAGLNWQNLAYQPYYSMTGSNVAFGFWSHDIVGPANDHEMHARWVQIGAFSAIYRSHDRGMSGGGCANSDSCGIVKIWTLPDEYFEVAREALVRRERLVPHLYTAMRTAFDTGVSVIRPMYYEFPEQDMAYSADQNGNFPQYFFGSGDMFVSPIVSAADKNTSMTTQAVWIPPGTWYDIESGALRDGDSGGKTVLTKAYTLDATPRFIKAGAIIPEIVVKNGATVGLATKQYDPLVINIYPGANSGETKIYEDDGMTTQYLNNKFVWTSVSYTRDSDGSIDVTISSDGSYDSFPSSRSYIIRVMNSYPLQSGSVNGNSLSYNTVDGQKGWRYDGLDLAVVVDTGAVSTSKKVSVNLKTSSPDDPNLFSGLRGAGWGCILSKRNLDASRVTPGANSVSGGLISDCASTPEELEFLAGSDVSSFTSVLKGYRSVFDKAVAEILSLKPSLSESLGAIEYKRWIYSYEILVNAGK